MGTHNCLSPMERRHKEIKKKFFPWNWRVGTGVEKTQGMCVTLGDQLCLSYSVGGRHRFSPLPQKLLLEPSKLPCVSKEKKEGGYREILAEKVLLRGWQTLWRQPELQPLLPHQEPTDPLKAALVEWLKWLSQWRSYVSCPPPTPPPPSSFSGNHYALSLSGGGGGAGRGVFLFAHPGSPGHIVTISHICFSTHHPFLSVSYTSLLFAGLSFPLRAPPPTFYPLSVLDDRFSSSGPYPTSKHLCLLLDTNERKASDCLIVWLFSSHWPSEEFRVWIKSYVLILPFPAETSSVCMVPLQRGRKRAWEPEAWLWILVLLSSVEKKSFYLFFENFI